MNTLLTISENVVSTHLRNNIAYQKEVTEYCNENLRLQRNNIICSFNKHAD